MTDENDKLLWAASTGGFYLQSIHLDSIPADAVEVTPERRAELLAGEATGKRIVAGEDGAPALADPPPITPARVIAAIKAERDRRTQEGGYKVAGKWFHSDQFSRGQQLGLALLGAGIPAGLQWKTMDGSFVTMTQALAGQILAAVAASDAAIFAHAEQLIAEAKAAAEPSTINPLSGWPETFGG